MTALFFIFDTGVNSLNCWGFLDDCSASLSIITFLIKRVFGL